MFLPKFCHENLQTFKILYLKQGGHIGHIRHLFSQIQVHFILGVATREGNFSVGLSQCSINCHQNVLTITDDTAILLFYFSFWDKFYSWWLTWFIIISNMALRKQQISFSTVFRICYTFTQIILWRITIFKSFLFHWK